MFSFLTSYSFYYLFSTAGIARTAHINVLNILSLHRDIVALSLAIIFEAYSVFSEFFSLADMA